MTDAQTIAGHTLHPNIGHDDIRKVIIWYQQSGQSNVTVADVIMQSCAVGFGGHYDEILDNCTEGEFIDYLAGYLAPGYNMNTESMYLLLDKIRTEFCRRLSFARNVVAEQWRNDGFPVRVPTIPSREMT